MNEWELSRNVSRDKYGDTYSVSPFVRDILSRRGLTEKEEIKKFLFPKYERDIHDPFLLSGMGRAVKRINSAILSNEKIAVFADYDADGIPGSVIFHDFFTEIGYQNFQIFIPHRNQAGFGLNEEMVRTFIKNNVRLVITVDCGVTAVREIKELSQAGVDVIVTDHHEPPNVLPPAHTFVHPLIGGRTYPFPHLSGGALAFKVVSALVQSGIHQVASGWEKWLLDLAAISTCADMVPLQGENRALVYFGIKVLKHARRAGIRQLLRKKGIMFDDLNEDDIGFVIAPHINAASRMDDPYIAFLFLSSRKESEAMSHTEFLIQKNNDRKKIVEKMLCDIDNMLISRSTRKVISLGDKKWRPGVLGLAASRVVKKYNKPVCLWGVSESDQTIVHGSCRSDGSVNVVELMEAASSVKDIFFDHGGHAASGGFSASYEKVNALENLLDAAYDNVVRRTDARVDDISDEHMIEKKISPQMVTWENYNAIRTLAPFGKGNPRPLFLWENVMLSRLRFMGKKEEHVSFEFYSPQQPFYRVRAVYFFFDERVKYYLKNTRLVSIVGSIERDRFNGKRAVMVRVYDVIPTKN